MLRVIGADRRQGAGTSAMMRAEVTVSDPTVELLLARSEVERLQSRYADVVTRRAWPELIDLFEPDAPIVVDTVTRAPIHLTGPVELGEFIGGAIERFDFFSFTILNAVSDADPDSGEGTGRIHLCEVRHEAGAGWSRAFGRYEDRYRRTGGGWRIAERHYRSLGRETPESGTETFPAA